MSKKKVEKDPDYKPKMIAPRLANGESRLSWGGRLPEQIKDGLRDIALHEGRSVSWVMEEVVINYFNLKRPKYIVPKTVQAQMEEEAQAKAEAQGKAKGRVPKKVKA